MKPKRKKPEQSFQDQVLALAGLCGWRRAHFRTVAIRRADGTVYHATPVQADGAGFPDVLLLRDSELLIWELKIPPNKPSAAQLAWIEAFRAAGIEARIVTPDDWPYIERRLMAAR